MMRFTTYGSTGIVKTYPDKNPFDIDPPLWNLTPFPSHTERYDTPEFREAACAIARTSGMNPLLESYGTCPLNVCDPELDDADLPFTNYETPPPLPQVTLSEPLVFMEAINPMGNTVVFKVRAEGAIRLLKVFRDQEVSMESYRKPEERPPHPLKRFAREKEAYEHLLHYGACEKGAVPQCLGWLDLTPQDQAAIAAHPGLTLEWQLLQHDTGLPKALLLEYFADAARMTIDNVTTTLADAAVRALYHVHASHVLHGDVRGRNILVLPDGRVVWVDFDHAIPASKSTESWPCRRQELLLELAQAWTHLYSELLPDKRIGFKHWLY